MEAGPIAGPSRPRRVGGDLADRIVALQRKNASGSASSLAKPAPPIRRAPSPKPADDFTRSPRGTSSKLFDPHEPPRSPRGGLAPPTRPTSSSQDITRGPRVASPGPAPVRRDLVPPRQGEYSRGPLPEPAQRVLFDPSRPNQLPTRSEASQLAPPNRINIESDERRRRPPEPPRGLDPPLELEGSRRRQLVAEGSRRAEPPHKTLFDPNYHDPTHFQPRHAETPSQAGSGSSRSLARLNGQPRTREEELDRERERRRRKEGSERGLTTTKKKDSSDSRSKGSRSSEGSESFKDRERGKGKGDTGVKAILKDIYDKIKTLEQELTEVHRRMALDPEAGISILLDRPIDSFSREIRTSEKDTSAWLDLIEKHKHLGDLHHEFLVRVFDPLVPSSLHQLTVRYNIPSRLWQAGFHLILERLRHAWMSSQPAALDLLTDLVYHAYKFYTDLLEDQSLVNFRTAWIEALGDLARYRMAIASRQASETKPRPAAEPLGRIDDDGEPESSGASIGAEVAQSWDVEDKETWRTTARDWYTMGITEKPGEGRLHHHLALLSRDIRGQEARALHHFTKSLTVTHEFDTSRESILPLFDSALQTQRSLPDATAMDLFVRLHGMLFTRIQLDDFPDVMSRFMERLEEDARLDGISRKATITQVDWMLMASVNISAVLQYGSTSGVLRKALAQEGAERRKQHASITEEGEEIPVEGQIEGSGDSDEGKEQPISEGPRLLTHEPPSPSFTYALQLAFEMLEHTLSHPNRLQGIHHVLNPYITLLLTFVATLFRQPHAGAVLIPSVPWHRLVELLNAIPEGDIKEETRLINGPPLPEDWTIRGMEWVGRRVYERGFWKAKGSGRGSGALAQPRIGDRFQSEMDVLLATFDSAIDISEGVVEEVDGADLTDGPVAVNQRRWRRVAWAGGVLAKHVDGLSIADGKVFIEGVLADRLSEIEASRLAEEEANKVVRIRDDALEEGDGGLAGSEGEDSDPELAALRERRRQLRSLINKPSDKPKTSAQSRMKNLRVVPGYTMLVFDTNVLLSSLPLFSKVVEGGQWSVIIPLPVVTELDGLAREPAPLGTSAKAAVAYLESRIRTHSLCLKIQTTKGNYLSDLLIRTEHHDIKIDERTMDDRILSIASFQSEHFVDRSALLGDGRKGGMGDTKVLLVTYDRNLRLRARARGVDAADEKELEAVLGA